MPNAIKAVLSAPTRTAECVRVRALPFETRYDNSNIGVLLRSPLLLLQTQKSLSLNLPFTGEDDLLL